MKVRVYTDYDPIRILNGDSDKAAEKIGITGNFYVVEKEDLPSREHRNEWKYDVADGKVKPDQVKVQAKLDAKAAKEARKHAVLAKLKISKDELEDLLK